MPGRRDFKRKSGLRDARLIVIAAEGEQTEKLYFEGLKVCYPNPRVHVEVLHRLDSASAPEKVMEALNQFRAKFHLRPGYDELWLVIDVDRWKSQSLAAVSQLCVQKQYRLAVSNPAFEIWLVLHVRAITDYAPAVQVELLANKRAGSRTRLELELRELLGSYNKSRVDMEYFAPRVYAAIERAQAADVEPDTRWPNTLGTRVYLLVQEIVPDGAV